MALSLRFKNVQTFTLSSFFREGVLAFYRSIYKTALNSKCIERWDVLLVLVSSVSPLNRSTCI